MENYSNGLTTTLASQKRNSTLTIIHCNTSSENNELWNTWVVRRWILSHCCKKGWTVQMCTSSATPGMLPVYNFRQRRESTLLYVDNLKNPKTSKSPQNRCWHGSFPGIHYWCMNTFFFPMTWAHFPKIYTKKIVWILLQWVRKARGEKFTQAIENNLGCLRKGGKIALTKETALETMCLNKRNRKHHISNPTLLSYRDEYPVACP